MLSAYFPITEQTAEALSHAAEIVEFTENDFLENQKVIEHNYQLSEIDFGGAGGNDK